MLDVMMEELKAATKDFYRMTGIKIVLYDEGRRVLYSYPETMCAFCTTVRTDETLANRCKEFDNIGFDRCEQTGKPYIYQCHMGLAEAITPILENGVIIGYMMMGQILREGARDAVANAMRCASRETGIDESLLACGLSDLKETEDSFIRSALSVMSMCVCYLYCNGIIKNRGEVLSETLRTYVENHFTRELSVSELCRRMYLSKSKLYQLSLRTFGMGVSDYIRIRRIEEAKKLLRTTQKPISAVGESVGFSDANYFTRTFKAETGMTPNAYRRMGT